MSEDKEAKERTRPPVSVTVVCPQCSEIVAVPNAEALVLAMHQMETCTEVSRLLTGEG